MPRQTKPQPATLTDTTTIGFEAKLWLAANKLRNNTDAAEPERSGDSQPQASRRASEARQYKHVALGLNFHQNIRHRFEAHRAKLLVGEGNYAGANPEDPDEPSGARHTAAGSPKGERGCANQFKAENVFWVPADARWSHLQANAKQPTIGKTVDDAMVAIERDYPRLKCVLPKDYGRPGLDKHRLGELIDLIATIGLTAQTQTPSLHPPAPTAPSICSAASMSISSPASPAPRARTAANGAERHGRT